ncbi:MAG TPA: PQQ-binding-like beta-propeller repeat protein [Polyangiaceae bacterium]|jgi:outer membrane protein assembly factor BamB|nr:PQQ-binding-like beta-propeller repeat protein [Polyangiaceae bacterium]
MNRPAAFLPLACVAALSACSLTTAPANPELPTWVHRPSWSMSTVYRQPIEAPSRDETEPYERGRPELDIAHRRVFVGSSDRGFYAVRAEDGTVLWRFETLGVVQCEPLYDPTEDVVYFGSNDGALYKVRAEDGALLWRFSTNAEVARRPVIVGSTVYALNANDTVIALDRKTGQRKWSQHRTPALGMEVAGYAGPLVWRGLVYAGFSDGTVTAYDALSGTERWQPVDLSAEAEEQLGDVPRYLDVDTTPVPSIIDESPVIYVASYEGGVFALDADNGSKVWQRPEVTGVSEIVAWQQPGHHGPNGTEPPRDLLFAASGTTGLWALDPRTGEDVWHRPLPDGGVSAPVPIAGALLVSTTLHGLFLMSPIDGSVIDGMHTGAGFSMAPAAYGLKAFILSNTGTLLALHVTPPPVF